MTLSAFFCVGAFSSALAGRLVERMGPAAALRTAAAGSGAVLVVTGVLGRSWLALTALVAAAGLANSLVQPAANLYVARGVSPRRHGLALGIQKSGIPAASLVGGLAVPTVGLTIGWSWAFVLGGLLACAASLSVRPAGGAVTGAGGISVGSNQLGDSRGSLAAPLGRVAFGAAGQTSSPVTGVESPEGTGETRPRPRPDVPMRLLVAVASSTCLAVIGSVALSSFFVLYSVDIGTTEASAGILLMLGSLVGIAARLLMGAGADRSSISPWRMLAAMFALAAVAFAGLATGSKAMMISAMPFAFATSFAWPGLFHLAVVRSNPSAPGAATGVTLTGSYIGAVCSPLLFGLIVETTGYVWAWGVAAITSAAAAGLMALVSRRVSTPR